MEAHDPAGLPTFYVVLIAVALLGALLIWTARRHRHRPFPPFWASALARPEETWILLMGTWAALGICAMWLGGSRPHWDQ